MVVLRPGMVPHPYLRRPPVVGPPGRVHHRQGDEDAEPNTANDQSAIPKDDDDTFYPSLDQVQEVREILRHIRKGKEELVPDEVVDMILDEAEYWPSISATLHPAPIDISQDRDKECLRTAPLCIDISDSDDGKKKVQVLPHRGLHPARKIVFKFSSRDQGWGGEYGDSGTYNRSYTWFDAYIMPSAREGVAEHQSRRHVEIPKDEDGKDVPSIIVPNPEIQPPEQPPEQGQQEQGGLKRWEDEHQPSYLYPFLPPPTKLQCNRTATKTLEHYNIAWHYRDSIAPDSNEAADIQAHQGRGRATLNGQAVRDMCVGDEVVIWLRARFPGWRNHLERMTVRVFWAA
ncbi:hypothetical protein VTN49DRAFT_6121 [Thermomyces lanuginosus]|uniref:uncharacterized protein n=1 Tax=Thermomyces lanuginosus TaxID=5541 RepID=UPI0037435446